MCGLISILDWEEGHWGSSLAAVKAAHRGLLRMHYRGTQPGIIVQKAKTILGHVRLPIINLTEEASQPMEVEGIVGAFVGEIFNYNDFYKTYDSDTEFLFSNFSHYELRQFTNFDGFWAAIFIQGENPWVVTDYLSQKPLYFHRRHLIVASEIEAIISALGYEPKLDQTYFANVLKWGYDPTGRTPWEGIVQLPAGSVLRKDTGWNPVNYWQWEVLPRISNFRSAFIDSVKNRLVGDRTVALLLSGGLDSTIVFKVLTKILKREIQVYHVENDEMEYVTEALDGYPSRPIVPSQDQYFLEDAIRAHQVPVDLGSVKPQMVLAKGVARDFVVAMSGDGADELFGGYNRAKDYDSQMSDIFCELPYYHLPRLDRIMMRETVELRTPYLAPSIVKYAMTLPWAIRTEKQVLKEAFKDLVPPKILNRPKVPLKAQEVVTGGITYRQKVINIWRQQHD